MFKVITVIIPPYNRAKSGGFIKGVNDSAKTLHELSFRLFEARVMPYYLHVLDKVKGLNILI